LFFKGYCVIQCLELIQSGFYIFEPPMRARMRVDHRKFWPAWWYYY